MDQLLSFISVYRHGIVIAGVVCLVIAIPLFLWVALNLKKILGWLLVFAFVIAVLACAGIGLSYGLGVLNGVDAGGALFIVADMSGAIFGALLPLYGVLVLIGLLMGASDEPKRGDITQVREQPVPQTNASPPKAK